MGALALIWHNAGRNGHNAILDPVVMNFEALCRERYLATPGWQVTWIRHGSHTRTIETHFCQSAQHIKTDLLQL